MLGWGQGGGQDSGGSCHPMAGDRRMGKDWKVAWAPVSMILQAGVSTSRQNQGRNRGTRLGSRVGALRVPLGDRDRPFTC